MANKLEIRQPPKQLNSDSDAVDLLKYVRVVFKRKKTVLFIFCCSVIITSLINLQPAKKETYEFIGLLRNGFIAKPVMTAAEFSSIMQSESSLENIIDKIKKPIIKKDLRKMFSDGSIVLNDAEGGKSIQVRVLGHDRALTEDIVNSIISFLVEKGNELYNKKIQLLNEQLIIFEERKVCLENYMKRLGDNFPKGTIESPYPLLQNTISNYENIYSSYIDKIFTLKEIFITSHDFETTISPVMTSLLRRNVNKILNVAIGGIVGLFLGIFTVLLQENLSIRLSAKEENSAKA